MSVADGIAGPDWLEEKVKIDKAILRKVKMPLIAAFETSGWRQENKACIIVELHSPSQVGYAECPARSGPWYSSETIIGAWHVMNDFIIPSITSAKDSRTFREIMNSLGRIRGHNMAKASIDTALLDLLAKERGLSLSDILGGTQERIMIGASIGIQPTIAKLLDDVRHFVDMGYKRVKLKIKPGYDEVPIAAVRTEFPDVPLMVDANGSYDVSDSDKLKRLDAFNLVMLEQPFAWDDLVDHATLQKVISTPICLDESISSVNDLKSAMALNSFRILNIKPARVGGLIVSQMLSELCQSNNIFVWCGGLMETGIGRASNVALASLSGFCMPNEIAPGNRNFEENIVDPPLSLNTDGTMSVPKGPGLGVNVQELKLEKYTTEKKTYRFV